MQSLKYKSLQNKSDWDTEKPTIIIKSDSSDWTNAYNNWVNGKNPTDSPEWKKGVVMTYQ